MTTTTAQATIGYVACDYTAGDVLDEVKHGAIRATSEQAQQDAREAGLDGVRYVGADGYLYVDRPTE